MYKQDGSASHKIRRPFGIHGHPGLRTITNYYLSAILHKLCPGNSTIVDIGSKVTQIMNYLPRNHNVENFIAYRPATSVTDKIYLQEKLKAPKDALVMRTSRKQDGVNI